jgi:hypothetical protein
MSRRWEDLDSVSNFVFTLPNVSEKDWLDMKCQGEILQAICVLKSGHINLSALPLYLKRGIEMTSRIIKMIGGKLGK